MNRSHNTAADLTLRLYGTNLLHPYEWHSPAVDVILMYRVRTADLYAPVIHPLAVEISTCILAVDATFEPEHGDEFALVVRSGTNVSEFLTREQWQRWQVEIAETLNALAPVERM